MDVMITLTNQELKDFQSDQLHVLLRSTGFFDISYPQKLYLCSSDPFLGIECTGVLGEIKTYHVYEINRNLIFDSNTFSEIKKNRIRFLQKCKQYQFNIDDNLKLSNDCWGLIFDSYQIYSKPKRFDEFNSMMSIPLFQGPSNMQYVKENSKIYNGLSMTKEEFMS